MFAKSFIFKAIATICIWIFILIMILRNYNIGTSYYQIKLLPDSSVMKWRNNDGLIWSKSLEPNEEDLKGLLQLELPYVPFDYWFRNKNKPMQMNSSCAKYPVLYMLNLHNNYWQTFQNKNVTYELFGAYYDKRTNVGEDRVVRVLAMINQIGGTYPTSYCHLWFDNERTPSIVPVSKCNSIWYSSWGHPKNHLFPHLLTCVVPKNRHFLIPQTVSVTAQQCETASNNLKVVYEPAKPNEAKGGFAVCVKGFDFPYNDLSVRLVEWLEMMRILGAHKIYTYNLSMHPNISKVLHYYEQSNFVEVRPLSLATGAASTLHHQHKAIQSQLMNKRLNEIVPYNDCFYRNMYKYDFIALLDIDEIIMPLSNHSNWYDLIDVAKRTRDANIAKCPQGYGSICALNVAFPTNLPNNSYTPLAPDIPSYMYMSQHLQRFVNHSRPGMATKCFHNTSDVLMLHNHFSLARLKACPATTLSSNEAQLSHYRKIKNLTDVASPFTDRSIWRFKTKLVDQVEQVLRDLRMLSAA